MRTTSATAIVTFRKYHTESYLITAMFKVHSQQRRLTVEDFTDTDQHTCYYFLSIYHETNIDESVCKIIFCT